MVDQGMSFSLVQPRGFYFWMIGHTFEFLSIWTLPTFFLPIFLSFPQDLVDWLAQLSVCLCLKREDEDGRRREVQAPPKEEPDYPWKQEPLLTTNSKGCEWVSEDGRLEFPSHNNVTTTQQCSQAFVAKLTSWSFTPCSKLWKNGIEALFFLGLLPLKSFPIALALSSSLKEESHLFFPPSLRNRRHHHSGLDQPASTGLQTERLY